MLGISQGKHFMGQAEIPLEGGYMGIE